MNLENVTNTLGELVGANVYVVDWVQKPKDAVAKFFLKLKNPLVLVNAR